MAWARFGSKQDHASQVINLYMPGMPQGVPIVIGKMYDTDRYYQILGVDWGLYYQSASSGQVTRFVLPRHGDSHTAGTGNDPAWIDTRNLLFGRARETDPQSMSVYVESLWYDWAGIRTNWPGGGIDLTDYVPADSGRHKYVIVYIDPDENALGVIDGEETPIPVAAPVPEAGIVCIPIAVVLLTYGDTVVTEDDMYDARILVNVLGQTEYIINRVAAILEADIDLLISKHIMEG